MLKTPAFTLAAVVTLALGIGVNAAMFSVVDQVLLAPLPYRSAARIVQIAGEDGSAQTISVSLPDVEDWRARSHAFQQIAYYTLSFSTVGASGSATLATRMLARCRARKRG